MGNSVYDAAKSHQYYEDHKHLKGRKPGQGSKPPPSHTSTQQVRTAQQKVAEIQAKLNHLRELLRAKVADEHKSSPENQKPTRADRIKAAQDSKAYRRTHKGQIDNLRKGAKSQSPSTPKTAESMSASELRTAISNVVTQLNQAISNAKRLRGG